MRHISKLGYVSSKVKWQLVDTRIIKIRKFKDYEDKQQTDFTADGKHLTAIIDEADPKSPSVTTGLQDDFLYEYKVRYLKMLLGESPSDLNSGKAALYVCASDGDLECDAVGCRIEIQDDVVIWHDFTWDSNSRDDSNEEQNFDTDIKVAGLDQFVFDRKEYEATLNGLLNKLHKEE